MLKKWLLFSREMIPVTPNRSSDTSFVRCIEWMTCVSVRPFSLNDSGIALGNAE
ncbi:hypothetical protein [Bifidobacterium pseudolongum]|uniref:hypothetical protein n=1 Tax=Bifidobacterium pseudolongum TaxID=1694 RepID=UPI0022E04E96|nr:hypothetical protein [Bifidobacterium pseudolongum]